MLSLSKDHYNEIKYMPKLLKMVEKLCDTGDVTHFRPERFTQLCIEQNCLQTFSAVVGNFVPGNSTAWCEAVRNIAGTGDRTYLQCVLECAATPEIHKSIAEGACRGDHRDLLEEFLPKNLGPSVHSTASKIAVQCNAIECLGYLLNEMSSDTWATTLDEAVQFKKIPMISVLLDHAPKNASKDLQFWANLTSGSLQLDDSYRIFQWVFNNTTLDALLDCHGIIWYVTKDQHQRLIAIHEHIVLSAATATLGGSSKRKVM